MTFSLFVFQAAQTPKTPHTLSRRSSDRVLKNTKSCSKVNITMKRRYEVLTLPMSANHISILTWGKAVSWNRNGLVQWAGGVEVPFVLSCLNTLVNSCQQGSHSAKGQGHLSCVQHIDIVPFHLPLSPSLPLLFRYHFPSLCLSLLLTVTLPLFLLSPSVFLCLSPATSPPLLMKGVNMQGTDMISSLISPWWMVPAPLLI